MGCFDDRGNLYLCNNDGSNLSNEEFGREQLPNSIRRLVDSDQDGHFRFLHGIRGQDDFSDGRGLASGVAVCRFTAEHLAIDRHG